MAGVGQAVWVIPGQRREVVVKPGAHVSAAQQDWITHVFRVCVELGQIMLGARRWQLHDAAVAELADAIAPSRFVCRALAVTVSSGVAWYSTAPLKM